MSTSSPPYPSRLSRPSRRSASFGLRSALLSCLFALPLAGPHAVQAQPPSENAKIVPADGSTNDRFGAAVAAEGDRIAVGANGDDGNRGSAYIYEFDGSAWNQTARLIAGDRGEPQSVPKDGFGGAVSLLGDRLLVGAPLDDGQRGSGSEINVGSFYYFAFDGSSWNQIGPRFRPTDTPPDAASGASIAQSGDRAIVSAPGKSSTRSNGQRMNGHGGVYIYEHNGGTFVETAILEASDASRQGRFGSSVALEGDRAVVGAWPADWANVNGPGSVYVIEYDGTDWVETAKLQPSDSAVNDRFGVSVALSGDLLFVGKTPVAGSTGGSLEGSVYLFEYDGSSWNEVGKLQASDGFEGNRFSNSLSATQDRLLVGAPFDDGSGTNSGAAYLYEYDGVAWNETKLISSDLAAEDRLGERLALTADRAVIGSRFDDPRGSNSGSVYVFELGSGAPVNAAPVADAGPDQTITCTTAAGAEVTLDGSGSSDADGDVLQYQWSASGIDFSGDVSPTLSLAPGTHEILLTVDDGTEPSLDTVVITIIEDTTPPVVTLNGDAVITLEAAVDAYAEDGATATDDCECGDVSISGSVDAGTAGSYLVTYSATDAAGNTGSATRTVNVVDTTPPSVVLTVGSTSLWPPNHKMHLVISGIVASDLVDGAVTPVVEVTSNEAADGTGDGSTEVDFEVVETEAGLDVYVRAERDGGGDGRVYTITVSAADAAGNLAEVDPVDVAVAKSQGKGKGKGKGKAKPVAVGPSAFSLADAAPNPFNPNTTIAFQLPEAGSVSLVVYSVTGQAVRTLLMGGMSAGTHQIEWDGRDDAGRVVSSGLFFYRLSGAGQVQTKRMTLLK